MIAVGLSNAERFGASRANSSAGNNKSINAEKKRFMFRLILKWLIVQWYSVNAIHQFFIGFQCPQYHDHKQTEEYHERCKSEYVDTGYFFEVIDKFHWLLI